MIKDRVRQLIDKKADAAAYRRLFDSADGKRVLRHLMRVGFVTKPTFVSGDTEQSTLNEGSRRLVLSIMKAALCDSAVIEQQIQEGMQDEN